MSRSAYNGFGHVPMHHHAMPVAASAQPMSGHYPTAGPVFLNAPPATAAPFHSAAMSAHAHTHYHPPAVVVLAPAVPAAAPPHAPAPPNAAPPGPDGPRVCGWNGCTTVLPRARPADIAQHLCQAHFGYAPRRGERCVCLYVHGGARCDMPLEYGSLPRHVALMHLHTIMPHS